MRGTAFADTINGDITANLLRGGAGADRLAGGEGNDTLRGDGGGDTMTGGAGSDTVTYDTFHFVPHDGNDTIADLELGRDVIDLTSFGFTSRSQILDNTGATAGGQDLIIDFNSINIASRIILLALGGIDLFDLDQSLLLILPA